ncbi:hypothetical protein [uncultured Chryseobacterium sp.]|uniref:hypothetical protein n=1 Tax=uncultured Chryseobacterium sp. TaxID=259322 RepID=UPI0025D4DF5C|nr:hypothetical protein [uncultured Chryseobacterium sp.]
MKGIYSVIFIIIINIFSFGQENIASASNASGAAEGNLYKATDDGQIYIGLRNGTVGALSPVFTATTFSGSGTSSSPYYLGQMGANSGQVLSWNSTTNSWAPFTDAATNNWFLTGNANAANSSLLGTTNNVRLQLRSNNTEMLELGTRQTLGLTESSKPSPYNSTTASTMYIRGTSGNSALQFQADNATIYKPVFFTDSNGNFKMRGSAASSDFFELGSNGASDNGRFDFLVGDDGDEPYLFYKYNYTSQTYIEMLRLQGTGLDSTVRVGINMAGSIPNSTLQISGSFSLPIVITSAALTLTELNFTVIIGGNHDISLPSASLCNGRIYIIKNPTTNTPSISAYNSISGGNVSTIAANSILWLQSINNQWEQIN